MNKAKIAGLGIVALGGLTTQEWLFLLSILVTVLGMIQDYMKDHKE